MRQNNGFCCKHGDFQPFDFCRECWEENQEEKKVPFVKTQEFCEECLCRGFHKMSCSKGETLVQRHGWKSDGIMVGGRK